MLPPCRPAVGRYSLADLKADLQECSQGRDEPVSPGLVIVLTGAGNGACPAPAQLLPQRRPRALAVQAQAGQALPIV